MGSSVVEARQTLASDLRVFLAGCLLFTFVACADGGGEAADHDEPTQSVDFRVQPLHVTTSFSAVATGKDSLFVDGLMDARITADLNLALGVSSGRQVQHVILADTLGQVVRVVGRAGDGPGEFRAISDLLEGGQHGSLAVWDSRLNRFTEFAATGKLIGTYAIPVPAYHTVLGIRDSVLITTQRPNFGGRGAPRGYTRWRLSGDSISTVHSAANRSDTRVAIPIRYQSGRVADNVVPLAPDCSASILSSLVDGQVVEVDTGAGTVDIVDLERGERAEIYLLDQRPTLEQRTLDGLREVLTVTTELGLPGVSGGSRKASEQRAAHRVIDSVVAAMGSPGDPVPSVWSDILWDGEDAVWLQRARCFDGSEPFLWDVIGLDGVHRATVAVEQLRLLAVREGLLLVQFRDDLDVLHVGLARLPEGVM